VPAKGSSCGGVKVSPKTWSKARVQNSGQGVGGELLGQLERARSRRSRRRRRLMNAPWV
jgi:hypothetical protein